ncbi:MAG: TolC family protein [Gemmatimonadota bacterium]
MHAAKAQAQTTHPDSTAAARALSLAEAIRLAEGNAEQVEIAAASVQAAEGQQQSAFAARLPQLGGNASYSRTLDSQFRGAFGGGGNDTPSCPPYSPNPGLGLEARVDSLEQAFVCGPSSPFGGADFNSVGFGSENTWTLGLQLSWQVYGGGRLAALSSAADAEVRAADAGLTAARAGSVLEVVQAYYDAQLSTRLVEIAGAVLEQAEATLQQTEARERVGTEAEFQVLRARVARDNQRPVLIERRTARDVAFFRLKQLLDLPLEREVVLTDQLEDVATALPTDSVPAAPALEDRTAVLQARSTVAAQEDRVDAAWSQHLPGLALTSSYGRVAYPTDLTPQWSQFRTNWTVGVALQVPLFTGGRIGAEETVARSGLLQAQARLEQTREAATLDTYQAYASLQAAQANWEASSGSVSQAERAYEIAEIRFEEGLSTQLELSDVRLQLAQARANRAQAARNLLVARTRVRLLPDLPVGPALQASPDGGAPIGAGAPPGMQAGPGAPGATPAGAGVPGTPNPTGPSGSPR